MISVKVFRLEWKARRLAAVLLATLGVMVMVYGDSSSTSDVKTEHVAGPAAPLLGDLISLVASVCYAVYQVFYKKYIPLPSDPESEIHQVYDQLPSHESEEDEVESFAFSEDTVYPPPFGLHANAITSLVGVATLLLLWLPLPLLHYTGVEPFAFPANLKTILAIAGMASGGVIFNATFMVS